jgi:hypothetical protein
MSVWLRLLDTLVNSFIWNHLEQKGWLREDSSTIHASTWVHALNNAYANFGLASSPRGVTITYPNGSETLGQSIIVPIT